MLKHYANWVIRWRYFIILATLVLVAVLGSGMRLLIFDTDYRVLFSEDNPQLAAFEELQNTYTKSDNVLFILAPKDEQVFTSQTLEAVEWLTNEAWQIPYSIRVDSISNFQHTYAEGDDLIVEDLITEAKSLSAEELTRIKEIALKEPLLVNKLVSPTAYVTGINIIVQLPGLHPETEVPEIAVFVRDLAKQVNSRYPHLTVHLTGIVMFNNTFPESTLGDMTTFVPAMFLVIIVLLGLLLRSFSGTFTTVLIIFLSIIVTMGIAGWLGITLTPPSATAPTIILTLAIADSVHFLVTMLYEMRVRNKWEAIIESLRINFQAIFLTSLTTAIGFLSLNASDVPPFRDLGNIVAIGVTIAFILSVSFLPAMMAVLPVRIKPRNTLHPMERFGQFVVAKRRVLMWGMASIIVLLIALIPRNELNDVFANYFDESFDFRRATDFATENLTGLYDINYSINAGESEGITDPIFLRKLANFAEWYQQQPEVIHVTTITDVFKRLNKNMHGDDQSYYRLPEQRDLAAQYLLLYEMSLPYGLDLNNQINIDKSATRLTVILKTISTNEMLALEMRAQQWLQKNGLASMQVAGASTAMMFTHIGYRNLPRMLIGTTFALVLISAILIIALRSFKYGLISLVPNLLPAGMAFGLWGFFVGQVGLGLSVVMGMTLGIVVDYAIHFLSKYLRSRREQELSSTEAVLYAFKTVGMALWITTLVLVAGFAVLALSPFQLNADMGLMTAITIALALIVDFLFLPPLLMVLERNKVK
ncbi:exporter of the RND superfamily [Beggiatoa sp. PS]|nr:exporter of the RND superfamily [Beggiatoa sp. PS]